MRLMLRRDYTFKQFDRGEGMTFHPCTGDHLATLRFSERKRLFYTLGPLIGCWESSGGDEPRYAPRISGSKRVHGRGEGYLSHWRFDPNTGQPLRRVRPSRKRSS